MMEFSQFSFITSESLGFPPFHFFFFFCASETLKLEHFSHRSLHQGTSINIYYAMGSGLTLLVLNMEFRGLYFSLLNLGLRSELLDLFSTLYLPLPRRNLHHTTCGGNESAQKYSTRCFEFPYISNGFHVFSTIVLRVNPYCNCQIAWNNCKIWRLLIEFRRRKWPNIPICDAVSHIN